MTGLKGFQKKHLRGLAHSLKPVVYIGQKGVTGMLETAIEEALMAHELIKIKFVEFKEKESKTEICGTIERRCGCELVGLIGHVGIFFRPHPEVKQRKIKVPDREGVKGK